MPSLRFCRIVIFVICAILISFGVIMVYNSTALKAYEYHGNASFYLLKHFIFILIGLAASFILMLVDIKSLQKWAKPALFLAISLLIIVLIPHIGRRVGGAQRWFHLGFFNFQPSEFAKLAIILYLADYLVRKDYKINYFFSGFLPAIMVICIVASLILVQPDLGTAVLLLTVSLFMLFIGGARWFHVSLLGLAALPVVYYLILFKPYRLRRMIAFSNPWEHKADEGYQLIQSLIALGSGGLMGVGLGRGQQKLFYLPAAHTDFIFSIVGEELGFAGAFSLIMLYIMFIVFSGMIAMNLKNMFARYIIFGVVCLIGLQVVVHIGSSTGFLPTKGLPLPFISYGGSALFFNMIAVALLLNVSRDRI
ncbi:MAG: putative lipid II flippase FtsW [Candidatus Kappaea frigidicola]|nr:putative lipid II flippase FtsW [Candidatus Kappaea frigidicola]